MDGHRCLKCGHYWASQASAERFEVITRFCPVCIPKLFPAIPAR